MTHKTPKVQTLQSVNPKDYHVRVIVSGTREWGDKKLFHDTLVEYMDRFNEPILFISGAAKTGADRFIIDWCKKYKYPCLEFPIDWDSYDKSAGYVRNQQMLDMATHLLCYWDTKSRGTAHLRQSASEKPIPVTTILVESINEAR